MIAWASSEQNSVGREYAQNLMTGDHGLSRAMRTLWSIFIEVYTNKAKTSTLTILNGTTGETSSEYKKEEEEADEEEEEDWTYWQFSEGPN